MIKKPLLRRSIQKLFHH